MIPDEKIPEIRERTDIVALIQQYVALKRVGSSFRGLCPFHAEKTPSFYVHPARQFFHCFGCQASGDVLSFYMRMEGVSFPDALRALAERAGIELPHLDPRAEADERRVKAKKERLVALMDAVAGFYVKQLAEHPRAEQARTELERRGVTPDTARAFRLGYAPHGWDGLASWLKAEGHSLADAEELGLVVPRKAGSGVYDRFRHRLMFPVSDHHGRIVAFSGRLLDAPADEPLAAGMEPAAKYLNSPENPLFRKGGVLFGLHEGRVETRREGWVIVCEGNFDLVALHQAGFANSVAPLGTAFTAEHARLLKRFAERVVLLFDGDRAGAKAVRTAFPLLKAQGLAARVVRLPDGDDPDTFLRRDGRDALARRIDAAPSILEHLIDDAAALAGGDPAAKAAQIESLGALLRDLDNPVEAQIYVERIARKFDISDVEAVRGQLRKGARAARAADARDARRAALGGANGPEGRAPQRAPAGGMSRPGPERAAVAALPELECELLGAMLDAPTLLAAPEGVRVGALLTHPDLCAILEAARAAVGDRGQLDGPALLSAQGESSAAPWLAGRLALQKYDEPAGRDLLLRGAAKLERDRLVRDLSALKAQIEQAMRAGDEERAMVLRAEHARLFRSAGSKSDGDPSSPERTRAPQEVPHPLEEAPVRPQSDGATRGERSGGDEPRREAMR